MTGDTQENTTQVVRELQLADAHAMRELFRDVFKKEMSQELWDWKYARPLSVALGVWRDDKLVAHYGAMGMNIYFKGKPAKAAQICDVMVEPSARKSVRNNSPLFLTTSTFIDRYVGYDMPFLLGYGFPNSRHMELTARLKLYGSVGCMWELTWELTAQPRLPLLLKTTEIDANSFAKHRAALDLLALRQREEMTDRIVIHKDADFVRWRYLQHPQEQYKVLLITQRLTGRPVGLCVLKIEAERVLWMDAWAAMKNMPLLAQAARAETWKLERRKLALWCSAPDVRRFGDVTKAEALPITTPCKIRGPGPSLDEVNDRWWLLAGDTDWL